MNKNSCSNHDFFIINFVVFGKFFIKEKKANQFFMKKIKRALHYIMENTLQNMSPK